VLLAVVKSSTAACLLSISHWQTFGSAPFVEGHDGGALDENPDRDEENAPEHHLVLVVPVLCVEIRILFI